MYQQQSDTDNTSSTLLFPDRPTVLLSVLSSVGGESVGREDWSRISFQSSESTSQSAVRVPPPNARRQRNNSEPHPKQQPRRKGSDALREYIAERTNQQGKNSRRGHLADSRIRAAFSLRM